jgi:hypothetical protein
MSSFKILLLVLCAVLMLSPVFADTGFVNEPYTIWATVINGTELFNADTAYVTVYNPDSILVVDNVSMTSVSIGTFIYEFIPNQTGNWLAYATFYVSASPVAVGVQSFTITPASSVEEIQKEFSMIGIVLGLIALILFLTFMGYSISRPKPNLSDDHPTNDNKRQIGLLFYFFALFVFIILGFVLMESAVGFTYYTAIRSLFIVIVTVFGILITLGTLIVFMSLFSNWMKDTGGKIYK